jgi:hypothetical protein
LFSSFLCFSFLASSFLPLFLFKILRCNIVCCGLMLWQFRFKWDAVYFLCQEQSDT